MRGSKIKEHVCRACNGTGYPSVKLPVQPGREFIPSSARPATVREKSRTRSYPPPDRRYALRLFSSRSMASRIRSSRTSPSRFAASSRSTVSAASGKVRRRVQSFLRPISPSSTNIHLHVGRDGDCYRTAPTRYRLRHHYQRNLHCNIRPPRDGTENRQGAEKER